MSLAKVLVVLVAGVVGGGAYLWSKGYRGPDGVVEKYMRKYGIGQPANAVAAPEPIDPLGATEGRWLVDEVTRDIAEIILFSTDSTTDVAEVLNLTVLRKTYDDTYEVIARGPKGTINHTVALKHHIWSPADHAPWAAAVLKAWGPEQPAGGTTSTVKDADGVALAMQLTDPTSRNVVKEERRISGLLTKAPLDPELHEQAALVIGTFALRENAGNFNDLRPALCRMAAHLSLARALRPASGTCGKLAEVVQLTLAMRQAEALELLEKLPAGLEPWVMALKLRNTGDWRLCSNPEKATFLEQIMWSRALARGVNPSPLQAFLTKHLAQSTAPDWSRAAIHSIWGVEHGHVFIKPSITLEIADFAMASEAWDGRPPKGSELLSFLNEPATRSVGKSASGFELTVLGWGQIAAFYQRHLCAAIYATDYFLRRMWGVPDQATAFEHGVHSQFSHLRLYPLLVRQMIDGGSGQFLPKPILDDFMRKAAEMCKDEPQLISSSHWTLLITNPDRAVAMPPASGPAWFQPSLPKGTAYDFDDRFLELKLPALPPGQTNYDNFWQGALALAPYDYEIRRVYVHSCPGTRPPLERDKELFKNMSEFNIRAMRRIAYHSEKDAKAFAAAMSLVCAYNPNDYLLVADKLAEAGHKEEAAAAYQAAFDKASDRVSMANKSEWIVNYYFEQGRKEDALKIALHAAEVYSASGLETAGKLMERMEKWEEAAGYYEAIEERYDDSGPMVQFIIRRKEKDPAMAELYKAHIDDKFPRGFQKAVFADFLAEPDKGVEITGESEFTRKWNLRAGDIIVALDGIRIETFPQYNLVRSLQPDTTPLALIVWNGTRYREVSATVPKRRFKCGMETYPR
jgi:tetratricopeptide (TPR) repeat protein